jgi:type I restriction enzyme, S subunit
MSKNWDLVNLEKIIQHRKEFIEIDDFKKYKRCRVKLHAQGIELRDVVQGVEIKTKKQQICKTDDFLVAEIDAKIGGFGIVPANLDGAIVSSHYFLFEINESMLDIKFLDYFIRTPAFRDQVSAQGSTNYAAIRPNDVLGYTISLPPLEEQRKIVMQIEELVGKVEEVRSLRQKALEETEAFITSLHLSLADSKIVTLDEILTLDEQQEQVLFGKKYPQVGVKGFGGGLFSKEAIDATQTTYKAFNCLYEGALVLSQVKGWEGAIAICPSYLVGKYVSPEYRTFRCIPGKAIPEYLSVLVVTPWFWTKLKDLTRGMGGRRERTRPEQFLKMKIPMPRVEYQQKAISIFNKIHKMKAVRVEAMKEIDALLPSILDRAFKGEL